MAKLRSTAITVIAVREGLFMCKGVTMAMPLGYELKGGSCPLPAKKICAFDVSHAHAEQGWRKIIADVSESSNGAHGLTPLCVGR